MWTCSKCGEQIEDQFDSCWRCAQTRRQTVAVNPIAAHSGGQLRRGEKFRLYWKRGWRVWLMMLCISLGQMGVLFVVLLPLALIFPPLRENEVHLQVAAFVLMLIIGPVVNYSVFAWFYGEEKPPPPRLSKDEAAFRLYEDASKLQAQGKTQAALAVYQEILDRFGDTTAARDAKISIENLRPNTG